LVTDPACEVIETAVMVATTAPSTTVTAISAEKN